MSWARLHADHAGQATTAQQVEQQRLHLIVGVMGNGDELAMRNLAQEAVARLPCRLLQRAALPPGQRRNIDLASSHGQPPLARHTCHKLSLRARRWS